MRRLIAFGCAGAALGGSLDDAEGPAGLLMMTGGGQTRIGSHRMYERLAKRLAEHGFPVFRFDRRGVGDSDGEDPGFRGSAPDIKAAAAAFRAACPQLRRLIGFGLCDGATALALFGGEVGLDGLILVNPWLVVARPDEPPPAAIRRHYRRRLSSWSGWKRIIAGSISYAKLFKGIRKAATGSAESPIARDAASSLTSRPLATTLILARGDATAIAAADMWRRPLFEPARSHAAPVVYIETDSHTFARPGDDEALLAACLNALGRG